MSTSGERWSSTAATARGSSHMQTGAPNQDAHAVTAVVGDDSRWVAAVADGHGGSRYIRSDRGSRLAVDLAVRLGLELVAARGRSAADAAQELPARLLPAWRSAVLDDIARRPFTEDERDALGVDPDLDPLTSYGATLVVAIVRDGAVGLCQIGDGDVVVRVGADVLLPVPGDDRLVGNETTSLCMPSAGSDFRTAALPDADLVLLSSDGYGNSFADRRWAPKVVNDLSRILDEESLATIEALLPEWVAESAKVGGDDVTVILLVRGVTATSAAAPSAAAPSTAAPSDPAQRQGRRIVGGAGVIAAVVVAATMLGLRSAGSSQSPLPATGATPASVVATSSTASSGTRSKSPAPSSSTRTSATPTASSPSVRQVSTSASTSGKTTAGGTSRSASPRVSSSSAVAQARPTNSPTSFAPGHAITGGTA